MGQIFYDMGFLATVEVVECSATDLIGQYVGQTGPKTQKLLERALGKVLFIDEAYRLGEGHFATEAINELVDGLTKPKFLNKLVTILAGYDADINRLLSINAGLTSRFPETITFKNLSPEECLQLLIKTLEDKEIDTSILLVPANNSKPEALNALYVLSQLPSWGNGRDIQQLAKDIYGSLLRSESNPSGQSKLTAEALRSALEVMIQERRHRASAIQIMYPPKEPLIFAPATQFSNQEPPPVQTNTFSKLSMKEEPTPEQGKETEEEVKAPSPPIDLERDPSVSDEVWTQLQKDKQAADQEAQDAQTRILQQEAAAKEAALREQAAAKAAEAAEVQARERERQQQRKEEIDDARRRHEEERLALERAQRYREYVTAQLEAERKRQQEAKRREQRAQEKLRQMGVCVAGYRWIKQQGGYRCAGGSHFVGENQLGLG